MSSPHARVLVVEDDQSMRALYSYRLVQCGYRVQSAEDGFSALAEIRKQKPDVIVSDLNMPGMSGFELLSIIRRRFPEVQVVAMSGAFSGMGVPPGVTADAFYEKGRSGLDELLDILETMTDPDRLSNWPANSELAPVWIPRAPQEGTAQIIVTCPECLRAFACTMEERAGQRAEVACVYCFNPIQYETEERCDRPRGKSFSSKSFSRKTGAGISGLLQIPSFT